MNIKGWYEYKGKKDEMTWESFAISGGKISGGGSDSVGKFTISGSVDGKGRLFFDKAYMESNTGYLAARTKVYMAARTIQVPNTQLSSLHITKLNSLHITKLTSRAHYQVRGGHLQGRGNGLVLHGRPVERTPTLRYVGMALR
jgi:hypothetical protein